MSSPKRIEKVNVNLGTGTAVTTFPLNFGPDGAGYGSFYRTASGVSVSSLVELRSFQGYDGNGLCRSLNGRLTGVHKVLCRAGEIACKGRKDFYLRSDGGFMIPVYSKSGHEMRMHFDRLVTWYGRTQLIPVYIEDNIFFLFFEQMSDIHRDQHCEEFSSSRKRLW